MPSSGAVGSKTKAADRVSNRDRKRASQKKAREQNVYSHKHVRLLENILMRNHPTAARCNTNNN